MAGTPQLDPIAPSNQHRYAGLPDLTEEKLLARRELVYLVLSGLFLGSLAMLNILGVTRFIKLAEIEPIDGTSAIYFAVAIGVLPYPITFLCTDFISEIYGRARANRVVWMGLVLNIWVVLILWLGGVLPGFEAIGPNGKRMIEPGGPGYAFFEVRRLAFGAVLASMIAYVAAQLIDVHLFHFWKKLTHGKHLWLRNNGSTMVSQLVDTVAVILITWFVGGLTGIVDESQPVAPQLVLLIATGYAFKWVVALVDTIPFYFGSVHIARYLRTPPPGLHPSGE